VAYPLAAHIVVLVSHDGAVHLREQVGRLDQVDGLLEVLLLRVRVRVRVMVRVRVRIRVRARVKIRVRVRVRVRVKG